MKKNITFLLLSFIGLLHIAQATRYTVVGPNGAYSYSMPNTTNAITTNSPAVVTTGGNLAGALAASAAARSTGNPAAAMGAQNALVNAGSSIVSGAVIDALNPLIQH